MTVKILQGDCRDVLADRLQRDAILIEMSPDYIAMARARIFGDAPLLAECT